MVKLDELLSLSENRDFFEREVARIVNVNMLGMYVDTYNIDRIDALAAAVDSSNYASKHMLNVPRFTGALELLSDAANRIAFDGLVLEFGVFSGRSITHLGNLLNPTPVYGFDSFEGLPEAWRPGFEAGAFATKGNTHFSEEGLPPVPGNVKLIKGWFDRTLPSFLDTAPQLDISLLHVDCDLYTSTKTIFHHLRDRIVPGTLIAFDEYYNYAGWRQHEYLAFKEFIDYYNRSYEYIGLVPHHQQVLVRIIK